MIPRNPHGKIIVSVDGAYTRTQNHPTPDTTWKASRRLIETHWPTPENWDKMIDECGDSEYLLRKLLDTFAPDDDPVPDAFYGIHAERRRRTKVLARQRIEKMSYYDDEES